MEPERRQRQPGPELRKPEEKISKYYISLY
jgi:hypothetical protein